MFYNFQGFCAKNSISCSQNSSGDIKSSMYKFEKNQNAENKKSSRHQRSIDGKPSMMVFIES